MSTAGGGGAEAANRSVKSHPTAAYNQRSSSSSPSFSSDPATTDGPRRSLRKREEKSYAESPDLIIEEVRCPLPSPARTATKAITAVTDARNARKGAVGSATTPAVISNGDVDMHSEEENEEEEDGVENMPVYKVTTN